MTPEKMTGETTTPAAAAPVQDPPTVLESATRSIEKATLVPLEIPAPAGGHGLAKAGFAHQLGLHAGEIEAVREAGGANAAVAAALAPYAYGAGAASPGALAGISVEDLMVFGRTLVEVRERAAQAPEARQRAYAARAALAGLGINTAASPLGMLNLERLEMAPAGVERGELIATIPLAPQEETAVVEKEWSVQSREFTSIVTDSLEQFSETGVTDNTELAQSTTSQQQHSNQFNITGTVSGGIPVIHGSASSSYTSQGSESLSATESRKQAKSLTQKASARSKQEHKVTISTKSVAGREETTTRKLVNSSSINPIRIDYFSLMRKWRVRLYRYGLRLTYDIVVPEPGASMRRTYQELAELKAKLGPFEFPVTHNDITEDQRPGDPQTPTTDPPTEPRKHYQVLADTYGATVPDPPTKELPPCSNDEPASDKGEGWHKNRMTFRVKDGYRIKELAAHFHLGKAKEDKDIRYGIDGIGFEEQSKKPFKLRVVLSDLPAKDGFPAKPFLGATGEVALAFFLHDAGEAILGWDYTAERTPERYRQWQSEVWNILYAAAQTKYYAQQQDIAARIAAIEDRLSTVDTLTLRREESDEVMRSVIRFIAGEAYQYMTNETITAFEKASQDARHGVGFLDNKLGLDGTQYAAVQKHENIVRFINQAIEWENVVSFLYSYFWDIPESWDFVRQIQHPDANRQAFLRAGSARVVLTVRKGWEERWLRFAESDFTDFCYDPGQIYLSIAQEIAAYDNRNYPGIPPANSGGEGLRLADSVVTTSAAAVAASTKPVTIPVESTAGFAEGAPVVIGTAGLPNTQEVQVVQSITGSNKLVVAKLVYPHDGTTTPFPVVRPGEKGVVIAEWNEYTPSSGTDIEVNSNLVGIV